VKAKTANIGNRVAQDSTFTVTAPGVTPNKTFIGRLKAAAEFVSFDNGASMSVDKTGGTVTITGLSNSTKLTFSKGSGSIIAADISTIEYQANGVEATSGTAIPGDPGASAKYVFTLTLSASENTTIEARTQQITVTAAGSQSATITLSQTAGEPYLELNAKVVEVEQDGSEETLQVTTNTTFTVS
jgi:hypothetical protein